MFILLLSWEPSVAQGTSALGRSLRFSQFFPILPTQLRIKPVKVFMSYDLTYKQTEITTLYDRYSIVSETQLINKRVV